MISGKASSLKKKIYPKSYFIVDSFNYKVPNPVYGRLPRTDIGEWSWCEIKYFLRLFDPRDEHQGAEDSFGASDIYIFM